MKSVRNFDDLMLSLATQVDFKTGESLFGLQQIDILEAEHKKKQLEFIKQQLLLQAFMDIKRSLPNKVYDEVVLRIAANQDKATISKQEPETPEQIEKLAKVGLLLMSYFIKIKKSIEYEVIPEVEQYLHRISKSVNGTLAQGNAVEEIEDIDEEEKKASSMTKFQDQQPDFVPLGDRYGKFKVLIY